MYAQKPIKHCILSLVLSALTIPITSHADDWTNKPYEIKGIYLGMTFNEFKKHNLYSKSDNCTKYPLNIDSIGSIECSFYLSKYPMTIAKQEVHPYLRFTAKNIKDDKMLSLTVISIYLKPFSYNSIQKAFIKKFGQPKIRKLGHLYWFNSKGSISLNKDPGSLGMSTILLIDKLLDKEYQKRKEAAEGKPEDDI